MIPTIASGQQPLIARTGQSLTPHSSASTSREEQRKPRAVLNAAPSGKRPMNAFEEIKGKYQAEETKTQAAETGRVLQLELPPFMPFQPMPLQT